MVMGEAQVNIATLNLGRDKPGGDAICIVAVDEPVSDEEGKVRALPQVVRVNRLGSRQVPSPHLFVGRGLG